MEKYTQEVEAKTGTRDTTYNLVSIIYHALQGAETYLMYVKDAEEAGESEISQFLREVITENRYRAEKAKHLLAQRIGGGS